ncbi:MAG TPA: GTP pyrophosphokinase family protein [Candidatus Fimicola cottocaccae]|uniref:GTP pyrophosphokinase n=1 Tax=Tyzzerella sp. An114 TaxID=1965545 RepID=UPI000B44971E|nr:GTP pyrophosphokinase family protein [Tyzzerella sp. An114]HIT72906.1 GTP pyrophosphokinase family protein [Candidatus Fimicola cottocaccae]
MNTNPIDEITKNYITNNYSLFPELPFEKLIRDFQELNLIYKCAIKEVYTKLEVLSEEFQVKRQRNPIEYMKTRVKSIQSAVEKVHRKGFDLSIESIRTNLHDMAGIRVVCSYVDDIYAIADMLTSQNDITLIEKKDYIKNPKPNGYRSLHLIVEVPVFFSDHTELVKVEVQIRTIAMDFWASLEHKLHYKSNVTKCSINIKNDLKECADIIAQTDMRMQSIHEMVEKLEDDIELKEIKI